MESPEPRRSTVGDYTPGVIGIIAIPVGVMLLFALNWVASQIGKIHSLPTLAVWITAVAAFPLFVFGVVQIVIYYRSYPRNMWIHSWIAFVGVGLLYEVFAMAWAYRSTESHATIVTGVILMVFGWVLYCYQRRVTDEVIADNPGVPFIGLATLVVGFGGGAFSWFLEHPAPAAAIQAAVQPTAQSVSTGSTIATDAKAVVYILGLGVLAYVVIRVLKAVGLIK